jgi:drug/metabolite transporter (DMT)-like permease
MSLLVALPCAVVAAVAYGAGTAVEQAAARDSEPVADAQSMTKLAKNPRWLLGVAADTVGTILHVTAIATGPVIIVQPLLVLQLPVSLPIATWLGAPRPGWRHYLACGWIVAGLAAFFAIVGNPGDASVMSAQAALTSSLLVAAVGVAALVAVIPSKSPAVKAATWGGVAGAWFGFVAVLLDSVTTEWQRHGAHALSHDRFLIPLAALCVLGAASLIVTQRSYQLGDLAASFPANTAVDPLVAVVFGVILLHESIPMSPALAVVYTACLGAIAYGTVRLAMLTVGDGSVGGTETVRRRQSA